MENLQDNSGFRNDQIGMNLSNGKTGSGDENSSVTNDWLEKTNDSVTNECGDKKIDSSENDSGKEKCLATNVSGEEKSGTPTNARGTEKKGATKICGTCGSNGSFQKCSRCKSVFYCSEECQKKDWPTHKDSCTKVLKITSEEKIKDAHKEQEKKEIGIQRLFVDRVLERAIRPVGSLQRAEKLAKISFPYHDIRTYFKDVPVKQAFPSMLPKIGSYVLVAFVDKYHENAMRHGIHIKDAEDKGSKVVFYHDDFDVNIRPSFRYTPQVKPGDYICLVDPVMHVFKDRTVGIRINNPAEVMVLNI